MDGLLALLWWMAMVIGGADGGPPCLVLGGLDLARTQAFVTDDDAGLRDAYVDDLAARADLAVLRSYRERGLRLEGMLLVRESCRVAARSPRHLTLDVVDRLGPTRVRTADGHERDLPRDRPTRRSVVLERTDDGWRVASVT